MNSSGESEHSVSGAGRPVRALLSAWKRFKGALRHLYRGLGNHPGGDSGPIQWVLDSIGKQVFATVGAVPVNGWARAEAGIETVEVHLNDVFLRRLDTGLWREDLAAAFPAVPDAGQSGFAGDLDLSGEPRGEHALALIIRDRAGNQVRINRKLRLIERESLPIYDILFGLDSPASDKFQTTGRVLVSGWACAATGVHPVEVYLDDVLRKQIDVGQSRSDVAALHPEVPGAGQSGFAEWLSLEGEPLGKHVLTVVIRSKSGREVRLPRTFRLAKADIGDRAAKAGAPIQSVLDSIGKQVFTTVGAVRVNGWARAEAGIEAVEVYLNDVFLRRLDTGLWREDLAAEFPAVPDAGQSGFAGTLDLSGEPRGEHALAVLIRDRAGNQVRINRKVRLVERESLPIYDRIMFGLDSPAGDKFQTTGRVLVAGWACAAAGVHPVEVYLDDVLRKHIDIGQSRPDVATLHPEVLSAGQSGFAEWLSLEGVPLGKHVLTVVIRSKSGREVRLTRALRLVEHEMLYHRYYLASLPTPEAEREMIATAVGDDGQVGFDLWLQVSNPADQTAVAASIGSIVRQCYPHWRLHLVAEPGAAFDFPRDDVRISFASPAELTARAALPTSYLVFLRAGELLAPGALSRAVRHLIAHPETMLLYADHDQVQPGGLHASPSLKPGWSPDHLLCRDYIGGVFFLRQTEDTVAYCRELLTSGRRSWRYEVLLRAGDARCDVAHLPEVLWSRTGNPPADDEAELAAVRAALHRRGLGAAVERTGMAGIRRLRWRTARQPKVSIIIPTTGNPAILRACVDSLLEKTRYSNYELLFLDNGLNRHPDGIAYLRTRKLRVVERAEPFNWARLNNEGARITDGELLLFLNDDIEVTEPGWLDELVSLACREDVGCVGALLVYPDDRIQHAGLALVNQPGGVIHYLKGVHRTEAGYEHLHGVVREVSCNTGACLIIRRDLFKRLGGFDESLTVVANDVDLCLRAGKAGYRNLWTPHSRLVHHESYSRKDINAADDLGRMWEDWGELLRSGDPYYNANLTTTSTDCSLNLDLLKERELRGPTGRANQSAGRGINLIGSIKSETGLGEALRGLASACEAAGVPFDIYNIDSYDPARMEDDAWAHKTSDEPSRSINLLHVNADMIVPVRKRLPHRVLDGRYQIGYWVWELPDFPDEWSESFRCVDEIWAPSAFVQEAVALKSPVPVVRIPYAVEKKPRAYLGRRHFGLPEGPFLLLMMYDLNSIRERKNPAGAIAAYKKAFPPNAQGVGLVIKLNNSTGREAAYVRELAEGDPNIHVLDRTLSRYEVDSLIHGCDGFLSLHRSEGFGLVIAEAMALGRPVIATHWSGNTDFMHPANAACVDYRLVQLERDYGPYAKGQWWAEPDLEHAAWWMRKIREDGELRRKLVGRAMRDIEALLSPQRVGALVANRLKYIRTL